MDMQNNSYTTDKLPAYLPPCPRCGESMHVRAAEFTARKRKITFACDACDQRANECSVNLQG